MYYSSFGALSLLITLIINRTVLFTRKNGLENHRSRYRNFLLGILLYYVSDILWGILYERHLIRLTYADTVFYFAAMALSVLLWTVYVVDFLNRKGAFSAILTRTGWLILALETVALIVNFFTPVLFSFDADGNYRPENARYATLAAQIALFLITSVYSLIIAVKAEGKARLHHRTIGLSGLVMAVFVILQIFSPLLPFYAIGCLIANCLIHSFVTEDERQDVRRQLGNAQQKAYTDSLTGVKSLHAYTEAKAVLNRRISDGATVSFGVVVFDLNSLKFINDTEGHDSGNNFLRSATRLICRYFKCSPVYRIGGDEFVAILEGEDYENRADLVKSFDRHIEKNQDDGLPVVISSGLSEYLPGRDADFNAVFERADRKMYERKKYLKERTPTR